MLTLLGAVLGLVFGSFIGVIVIRWPQGRSAAAGRSRCDHCGTPLRAVPSTLTEALLLLTKSALTEGAQAQIRYW